MFSVVLRRGGGEDLKMFVAFKQSWARDNTAATTRPYIQTKQLLLIALCLYSLLVSAALPRFHVDVVAKLKKGRVPSSVFLMTQKAYLMVGYFQMFEKDGIEIGYEG